MYREETKYTQNIRLKKQQKIWKEVVKLTYILATLLTRLFKRLKGCRCQIHICISKMIMIITAYKIELKCFIRY